VSTSGETGNCTRGQRGSRRQNAARRSSTTSRSRTIESRENGNQPRRPVVRRHGRLWPHRTATCPRSGVPNQCSAGVQQDADDSQTWRPKRVFHNGVFHTLEQAIRWYKTRDTMPADWYPTVGTHAKGLRTARRPLQTLRPHHDRHVGVRLGKPCLEQFKRHSAYILLPA